jgi:hypothetical protein
MCGIGYWSYIAQHEQTLETKLSDLMGKLAKGLRVIEALPLKTRDAHFRRSLYLRVGSAISHRCPLTLAEEGYCAYDAKHFAVISRVRCRSHRTCAALDEQCPEAVARPVQ